VGGTSATADYAAVAAGAFFSLAIKTNGSIWGWGDNSRGQLAKTGGADETSPIVVDQSATWVAIAAGADHSLAIRSDNTLWAWGYESFGQLGLGTGVSGNQYSPQRVGSRADWTLIAARENHSLGLTSDGCLWFWGDNIWSPTLVSCY
jgi:alpha-tubulin suppressor-like RCC1 family protein